MQSTKVAGIVPRSSGRRREIDKGAVDQVIQARISSSLAVQKRLLEPEQVQAVAAIASLIATALRRGNKLIVFGNGGSSADAQHMVAELVGRYLVDRRSLPAICLSDNPSVVTSLSNDYGFDHVFARQIEGFGVPGDVALGISTSGASVNVIEAIQAARRGGLTTVALTGASGDRLKAVAEHCIAVPSEETPRIQEGHGLVAHIVCELVERELAPADG